jgi:lysophospholipase L1-like esterase
MLTLIKRVALANTWLVTVILFSGSIGGSAGESEVTANPLKQLPGTLIIVGDSIMAGCADSIDKPPTDYTKTTAHLVALQGVRVVNLSRSGNGIWNAVSQRAEGGINFTQGGKDGTAVWITLGVNDFAYGLSTLEQYRERYLTFLSRIEPSPAQRIFCVTPLKSGFDLKSPEDAERSSLEDYRQVVREVAGAGHCLLVDTAEWFDAAEVNDGCSMPDTLHLGVDGHAHYAKNLLEQIRGDY